MLKKSDRTKDAHEKIQLGGLAVKAGLRNADKAFLLGVLITAARQKDDSAFVREMTALGKEAFKND
ncbi:conjugal transfer protein TraD [Ochrobactrum soli]|uniref:Conjugal transfer protein TraD n=1 Tax=Ochrobactrum soli TaxID=2448455 RepID=A0A849KSP5_9HYPH|nr:conjugal transfer protein TraD [[Ochrobactrum] soli]NNU62950.1 conjugal transfer protein TraD [[Ochrobactrum] soli]